MLKEENKDCHLINDTSVDSYIKLHNRCNSVQNV